MLGIETSEGGDKPGDKRTANMRVAHARSAAGKQASAMSGTVGLSGYATDAQRTGRGSSGRRLNAIYG